MGVMGFRLRCKVAVALAVALIAGIAALAPLAASYFSVADGIIALGAMDDGSIAAGAGLSRRIYSVYRSYDGGMSWLPDDGDEFHTYDSGYFASQSAETPRGVYSIGDFGVERIAADGRREIVYSTEYLLGDANEWTQERATRDLPRKVLTTRPSVIVYHAESGNVIVAMGIQGAAVETTDGRWHRVGAGQYIPTDFSFWGKARALLEAGWLVGAIALALSLSALTVVAAASAYERKERMNERIRDAAFIVLTALVCSAAFGTLVADISVSASYIAALLVILTSWIATATAIFKSDGNARWMLASLACVSALPLSLALLSSFGLHGNGCCFYIDLPKAALIAAAFIAILPPLAYHARLMGRHGLAFALAFFGMNALIALAFVVWLTLNLSLPSTQIAIAALVGLIAVVLARRVRGARRASPIPPPRKII